MDFILEDQIDENICDELVDWFVNSEYARANYQPGNVTTGEYDDSRVFEVAKKSTDFTFSNKNVKECPAVSKYLKKLRKIRIKYLKKYIPYSVSSWTIIEPFNIQWYKPGEGFFNWHSERTKSGYPACNRMLVWMTYLNDIEVGGGTEFMYQGKVSPKKGKTLIWPSDPTHTHKGEIAPYEDKYIITGWYSYREPNCPWEVPIQYR